jgi:hypothetical protein
VAQSNARVLCFWDSRIHKEFATTAVVKGTEVIDKMKLALEHGGNGIVAGTLEEAGNFASAQGFDGARVRRSIEHYNDQCRRGWETLQPARADNFGSLDAAPFYALVVRPAITHTHGGISVDAGARALNSHGIPVPGLFAAGADVDGVYGTGYAGGLALALGFGLEAAITAGFGPS